MADVGFVLEGFVKRQLWISTTPEKAGVSWQSMFDAEILRASCQKRCSIDRKSVV